jgi:hypothetical protein
MPVVGDEAEKLCQAMEESHYLANHAAMATAQRIAEQGFRRRRGEFVTYWR